MAAHRDAMACTKLQQTIGAFKWLPTGEASIEDMGWELFRLILSVAGGDKRTRAEQWGLHNSLALFNPGPVT